MQLAMRKLNFHIGHANLDWMDGLPCFMDLRFLNGNLFFPNGSNARGHTLKKKTVQHYNYRR